MAGYCTDEHASYAFLKRAITTQGSWLPEELVIELLRGRASGLYGADTVDWVEEQRLGGSVGGEGRHGMVEQMDEVMDPALLCNTHTVAEASPTR